jgi:sialate O-acetylesterase
MRRTILLLLRFSVFSALFSLARAELFLPHIFGDHMVLQAQQPAPVWGWAEPGASVTVSFAGQQLSTVAATDGAWRVALVPLTANATPRELTVTSRDRESKIEHRKFSDVLVGEVWLCSGQSNMEKPLGEQRGQKPTFNAAEEIAAANFPQIRFFKVAKSRAPAPARDVQGEWTVCTPQSIDRIKFSAAGYFFGRKIHRELGVPVGLIDSTWGGTRIEPWTAPRGFAAVPSLADFAAATKTPGKKIEGTEPATLYNAMIHPLAPYALRGALWYQGESNIIEVDDAELYADKMQALVQGWRDEWQREFSFYYVQVAPHLYHVVRPAQVASAEATPRLWEAQAAAQRLPRTGMIVTTDLVDDLNDIHPRNKQDVGERLARCALAKDYGKSGIEVSGPVFRRMEISGTRAILHFDHAEGGLVASDQKPLTWFTIAGADGIFYPGTAVIDGDTVAVNSPRVAAPTLVRFAWDEAARPNLANRAGLPAVPFRTNNPFLATEIARKR